MGKLSVNEIKKLFQNGLISTEVIETLKSDERKGVKQILLQYEKQLQKKKELEEKFREMCIYENRARNEGVKFIAGVDEAGRGPLAGPVVAAAVMLPKNFTLLGLNDSKQLSENTREKYFFMIKKQAISYGISIVNNNKIDEMNILEATKLAMRNAILQLSPIPEHILIDAVELTGLPCTSESIIKGDAKSISIAAASILAKVTRDHIMKDIHKEYPQYDFASNMGYGTKHHMESLNLYGITPYHRKSFAPVRNVIAK